MENKEQIKLLSDIKTCMPFTEKIREADQFPLISEKVEIFQMNVGRRCNLSCRHCHVKAGPKSEKIMPHEIFRTCLETISDTPEITTIDITGGAPEMNPHLRWFLDEAGKTGKRIIVRSNLLILLNKEYSRLIETYLNNRVEIAASLPDYNEVKTDRQRGHGVFKKIIQVIKILNEYGYGIKNSGLVLSIVHNPAGAYLPGSQNAIENEYRRRLMQEYGLHFSNLYSLTNLPVGRYLEYLIQSGNYEDYMSELCNAFNPSAIRNVMCKTTISVGWDGTLYDCDFNQMLDLPVHTASPHIEYFDIRALNNRKIVINNHCYGCVAGSGSSCQGATVKQ